MPTPGPSDYNPSISRSADSPRVCSLGPKPKVKIEKADINPGPNAYMRIIKFKTARDRQIRGNGGPKVTIKGRPITKLGVTPGPSDYVSHSMVVPTAAQLARNATKRPVSDRLKSTIEQTPGPADYSIDVVAVQKNHSPAYSLRKRLETQKSIIYLTKCNLPLDRMRTTRPRRMGLVEK